MKHLMMSRMAVLVVLLSTSLLADAVSGVYAGGPVYHSRSYSINELKSSGFTNVIVWTIHIESDGSLGFNGEFPLVQNGSYIGDSTYPNFRDDIASLKTGSTSITRVEFGLSAAGSGTYANVKSLLECTGSDCGTGPNSILYRNFQALRNAFPTVDALNNDDESTYHVATAAPFHIMLADIGFKTAIVPYTRKSFWQSFVNQVNSAKPGAVDALYLQVYAGGSGNNPCNWNLGIPVYPGLWSRDDSPSQVQSQMQSWKNSCGISGGFMWLYDDFDNSPQVAQYATAINNVFDDPSPGDDVLQKGVPEAGLSGADGAQLRYTFEVPAGVSSISIDISGGSGDADLYVNRNSPPTLAAGAGNDCRPYIGGNNESCTTQLAPYAAGTYHVMVHGYSAFSGVDLVADYVEGSNPTRFENPDDVNIPDNNATGVTSAIDSTHTGPSGTVSVEVNIVHTYKGDLIVDVIHPDGTVYNVHNRTGGSANNINTTYPVDAGSKPANGEWKLRVRDRAAQDVGYIDSWAITF